MKCPETKSGAGDGTSAVNLPRNKAVPWLAAVGSCPCGLLPEAIRCTQQDEHSFLLPNPKVLRMDTLHRLWSCISSPAGRLCSPAFHPACRQLSPCPATCHLSALAKCSPVTTHCCCCCCSVLSNPSNLPTGLQKVPMATPSFALHWWPCPGIAMLAQKEPQPGTGTRVMLQLPTRETLWMLQHPDICPFTLLYKFRLGIFVLTA